MSLVDRLERVENDLREVKRMLLGGGKRSRSRSPRPRSRSPKKRDQSSPPPQQRRINKGQVLYVLFGTKFDTRDSIKKQEQKELMEKRFGDVGRVLSAKIWFTPSIGVMGSVTFDEPNAVKKCVQNREALYEDYGYVCGDTSPPAPIGSKNDCEDER